MFTRLSASVSTVLTPTPVVDHQPSELVPVDEDDPQHRCEAIGRSPLQSSGAAPARDQTSRARRRTPALATGRMQTHAADASAPDPDERYVAIAMARCEAAGR